MGKKKKNKTPPPNVCIHTPPDVLKLSQQLVNRPGLQEEQETVRTEAFSAGWHRTKAELLRRQISLCPDPPHSVCLQVAIGLAGFALIQQSIYDIDDPTNDLNTIKHRTHQGEQMVQEFKDWTWDQRYSED